MNVTADDDGAKPPPLPITNRSAERLTDVGDPDACGMGRLSGSPDAGSIH